ncbi:phosphoadenosine phosphosulfate reductase domain-containing protein [Methylobacterium organophilum]|uniref:Phosphoadenosine phosphosulfate reductase n=1 Tax=Methylobacterium organophilum TaxID=410 RepID=A0ABQ4TCW3_METOR|nr:phosphoadenosine phosphosulfate reductase family protein [Methylobacterium organophilum]GJE29535.1 Phosphoadenosine phosphosulfate reductase [Methylobacterium organophilum]
MIDQTRAALAGIFERHQRVFLAFSGGKDSLALACLCEPWRDRLALLWVNTGYMLPAMVEFVRGHRDRYTLVELAPARPMTEQWREAGTPADIVPIEHLAGIGWREPPLQPWTTCCAANRVQPLITHAEQAGGPCALLFGQRRSDGGGTLEGLQSILPARIEVALPLWAWSTADVLAYVAEQGIQLHPHHDECPTSIECTCCPANLSLEKLRLLDRVQPDAAAFIRTTARQSLAHAAGKAAEIAVVLDGTGRAAREVR